MKAIVALTLLTLFFISACNSGLSKNRKHLRKYPLKSKGSIEQLTPHAEIHKRKTKKYKRQTKKHRRQTKTLPAPSSSDQILLPTVIHPVNGTHMVLVDPSVDKANQLRTKRGSLISPINASNDQKKMNMFYIDHTEVTVKQYKKTHPAHDQAYITGETCSLCPAMSVDWINADKHCRAVGKRLPTEAEWELAAGGSSKKPTYWSKTKRSFANLVGEKDGFLSVAPVGSFPLGAGPYGTLDMIGNVWEWVDTPHSPLPKNSESPPQKKIYRIVKGGGWTSPLSLATINYRNVVAGDIKNPTFGFRCVKPIS